MIPLNLPELSQISGAALSGLPSLLIMGNPLNYYLDLEWTGNVLVGCRSCVAMYLFLTQLQVFNHAKCPLGMVPCNVSLECPTPCENWGRCIKFSCSHVKVSVWWSLRWHRQRRYSPTWKLPSTWQSHLSESARLGWNYLDCLKKCVLLQCRVKNRKKLQLSKLPNGSKSWVKSEDSLFSSV